MSETAGQADIESVLHSIRRLVSDKTLPRLVLTSEQRVARDAPLVLGETMTETAPDQRSLEARIAELEAVVAARSAREGGSTTQAGQTRGDVTAIDEEVLRDMVSGLVREELQGAMGERITRNMRRLVRREIMRAIAAGDLD